MRLDRKRRRRLSRPLRWMMPLRERTRRLPWSGWLSTGTGSNPRWSGCEHSSSIPTYANAHAYFAWFLISQGVSMRPFRTTSEPSSWTRLTLCTTACTRRPCTALGATTKPLLRPATRWPCSRTWLLPATRCEGLCTPQECSTSGWPTSGKGSHATPSSLRRSSRASRIRL